MYTLIIIWVSGYQVATYNSESEVGLAVAKAEQASDFRGSHIYLNGKLQANGLRRVVRA